MFFDIEETDSPGGIGIELRGFLGYNSGGSRSGLMDTDITRIAAHKRTRLGIIHIPEGRRVFPSLTVIEIH